MQETGALAGLRVLDLSRILAGPSCMQLLELVDAASSHGGLATRLLLRSGGRAGASAIAYDPPRHVAHVAFGTQVEIGGSFRGPDGGDVVGASRRPGS